MWQRLGLQFYIARDFTILASVSSFIRSKWGGSPYDDSGPYPRSYLEKRRQVMCLPFKRYREE